MKFLILHGSFGSKDENWFPQLQEKLELLDQEVILPQFPVDNWDELASIGMDAKPQHQTLRNWMNHFEDNVLPQIKGAKLCIVAHSLGPLFTLLAIDKFNIQLDSAIFVAPFLTIPFNEKFWQIDTVNKDFYGHAIDFEKLKKLIPTSYALYSNNDPYVPVEDSFKFARALNSSLIEVKDAKHMSSNFNLNEFPLVLELCKSRIDLTLYQKYLAHFGEYFPSEIVIKSKEHAIILPSNELIKEGTFHFRNLQKVGFCTFPIKNIKYWETESKYLKEGRLAAKRVNIERVFIINSIADLKKPELRQIMNADLEGGIIVYYCLEKDLNGKVKELDFGIWDDNYVCTVMTKDNGEYFFSMDSRVSELKAAENNRDFILEKAKRIIEKI